MVNTNTSDYVELAILAGLIIFSLLTVQWTKYRKKHRAFQTSNTPILLSYYTDGVNVIPLKHGKIGDLNYSAMLATNPLLNDQTSSKPALLFRIELPFASSLHLLGIPRQSGADQINPAGGNSIMERAELEGDYANYFTLFCETGMQAQTRYALDPKAMVFTLDFCQSHNWEIVGNELYFVQSGDTKAADDPTPMFDDIATFVTEIRPALETPISEQQLRNMSPYGEDRRVSLDCPVCKTNLKNTGDYFVCLNGHGYLLQGPDLARVKKGTLVLTGNYAAASSARTAPLTCPSCQHPMEHVNYAGGDTMIDSCPNCPYRWLDTGELTKITS